MLNRYYSFPPRPVPVSPLLSAAAVSAVDMSFLGPPQRGYDPLTHPELTHLSRVSMNALSSFDNLAAAPPLQTVMHPNLPPTPTHGAQHVPQLVDRSPIALPKVGETRCCKSSDGDRSSIVCISRDRAYIFRSLSFSRARCVCVFLYRLGSPQHPAQFRLLGPCPRKSPPGAGRPTYRQVAPRLCPPRRTGVGGTRPGRCVGQSDSTWECHPVRSVSL